MEPVPGTADVHPSPSGAYALEIFAYTAGPGTWNYSRGLVREVASDRLLADVRRNLAGFWFAWVLRADGEYLLCGEDYQGYNVIDLAREKNVLTFPNEAYEGQGFCWGAAYPSPSGKLLAVEGCYWAAPSDIVIYDFSEPLRSPLPEVARIEDILQAKFWLSDSEFAYTVEVSEEVEQHIWRALPGST
jgi:hypothetical protein